MSEDGPPMYRPVGESRPIPYGSVVDWSIDGDRPHITVDGQWWCDLEPASSDAGD